MVLPKESLDLKENEIIAMRSNKDSTVIKQAVTSMQCIKHIYI